jgi:hypothetical protein
MVTKVQRCIRCDHYLVVTKKGAACPTCKEKLTGRIEPMRGNHKYKKAKERPKPSVERKRRKYKARSYVPDPKKELRKYCQWYASNHLSCVRCDDCGVCRDHAKLGFHHITYDFHKPLHGVPLCWTCHTKHHHDKSLNSFSYIID